MMPESWWILALVGVTLVIALGGCVWWPLRAAYREARFARARRDFHCQRERLEAKFVRLAAAGPARDVPQWADWEFEDDVAYVRSRSTGQWSAFVRAVVALDELGGDAEDDGHRMGTAIFRFDSGHWDTEGRVILNLSPAEAIRFYKDDIEMIGQELAGRPQFHA